MKILELRFTNLNSLYGEWLIDFTNPEYLSNGIFALTGPTGAGKSTLLDAICLALYGATPRLGKITKSSNEIMSRQTGECYAEVVFESQAGRFRCHWEQRRARKKADGALQIPEHQIADADSGTVIESKKSRVATVIEEKTGMDFDRFTRSILLAQGGFDTFLKAETEQKSRILEQITGTEIYSEISRRVHERQRDEREKLNLLQAELTGITLLEPEQAKEIQRELEIKQKEETTLTVTYQEVSKAIQWLKTIEGLQKEIGNIEEETDNLTKEIAAFSPEREKLVNGQKAATLEGDYATLNALRKQQQEDNSQLKKQEEKKPELEKQFNKQTADLQAAELQSTQAKRELKDSGPIFHEVRLRDQKLIEQHRIITEAVGSCNKINTEVEKNQKQLESTLKKKKAAERNLQKATEYLEKHLEDGWLIGGLAGLEEQLNNLIIRQKEIVEQEKLQEQTQGELIKNSKNLETISKQCLLHKNALAEEAQSATLKKEKLKELLGEKILREYRTEKETLLRELTFLAKIAELEDHRAKLADGIPCPLCGSQEHPYATGNVPVADKTEKRIDQLTLLIDAAEQLETAIKEHEITEKNLREKLAVTEKQEATATSEKKNTELKCRQLQVSLAKFQTDYTTFKETILGKLKSLAINEIDDSKIIPLLQLLKERLGKYQQQQKTSDESTTTIAAIDGELKKLDAVIETHMKTLNEKQLSLDNQKEKYTTDTEQRKKLFGIKNPDTEEKRLEDTVSKTEKNEKQVRVKYDALKQQLTSSETTIESLKQRIAKREDEEKQQEGEFSVSLQSAGFSDEGQYLKARLSTEQLKSLALTAQKLDEQKTALGARKKDRQSRLREELEKQVTDETQENLESLSNEQQNSLKELRDNLAGLKLTLIENGKAQERIKDKQTIIKTQKKETGRWEKLHALIGSADGKKYRNFAQGLTFEIMVSHANRQLAKMTERYLLIRDKEKPLELNVVDNYQAGEIRSTRNLSGGESFIVSLTLALGLSKMASQKVRVDSLFLDEGFGTLDEEALETALSTLSGLQQDGKLIGVISHVSALKERISTQITVLPNSGGRSSLIGPGCSSLQGAL